MPHFKQLFSQMKCKKKKKKYFEDLEMCVSSCLSEQVHIYIAL